MAREGVKGSKNTDWSVIACHLVPVGVVLTRDRGGGQHVGECHALMMRPLRGASLDLQPRAESPRLLFRVEVPGMVLFHSSRAWLHGVIPPGDDAHGVDAHHMPGKV